MEEGERREEKTREPLDFENHSLCLLQPGRHHLSANLAPVHQLSQKGVQFLWA